MSDNTNLHDTKYGTSQAAKLLGVSMRTLQQLAAKGSIRSYRLGRKLIFAESDLMGYMALCGDILATNNNYGGCGSSRQRRSIRRTTVDKSKLTHLRI